MTLEQTKKFAANIQRMLKVRHVSLPIAKTEKGELSFKFTKDQEHYDIILDAVPLNMNDYDNREFKSMLEKYLFEEKKEFVSYSGVPVVSSPIAPEGKILLVDEEMIEELPKKKKRGRPAKKK